MLAPPDPVDTPLVRQLVRFARRYALHASDCATQRGQNQCTCGLWDDEAKLERALARSRHQTADASPSRCQEAA